MMFPKPLVIGGLTVFAAAVAMILSSPLAHSQTGGRVFELRTYTTNEGKLEALQSRFRDHTIKLFEKHGMQSIGYWVPQDAPQSRNTLIYVLAHPSRQAAKANWAAFGSDPEWKKVQAESEANGKIVSHVDSVFMDPADFSALR